MVAIVIPYYNIDYFEKTLGSLSKQTEKRFNVYIGNDNSANNPDILLQKYQNSLSIFYTKFENNLGSISLVKHWERCIKLIKDEQWIMILGDDDVLDKNCISCFYENYSEVIQNNIKVIRFASRYIDCNDLSLKNYSDYQHPKIEKATDSFFRNFSGQSRSSLSEHIFNKVAFLENHFFDYPLAWYSDDRAWLEFSNFKSIYTINDAFVSVRVTNTSLSGKNDNILLKQKSKELFFDYLTSFANKYFTNSQNQALLLEYGTVLKNNKNLKLKKASQIAFKLILNGGFVSFLKFIRRFYIATHDTK